MRCTRCGAPMHEETTDLPFKVGATEIVVVRGVPVLECENCTEYLLLDAAMERIEEILEQRTPAAEIEVVRFAV